MSNKRGVIKLQPFYEERDHRPLSAAIAGMFGLPEGPGVIRQFAFALFAQNPDGVLRPIYGMTGRKVVLEVGSRSMGVYRSARHEVVVRARFAMTGHWDYWAEDGVIASKFVGLPIILDGIRPTSMGGALRAVMSGNDV